MGAAEGESIWLTVLWCCPSRQGGRSWQEEPEAAGHSDTHSESRAVEASVRFFFAFLDSVQAL